jgi:mannose-1-phosphate guanylyltransferase
MTQNTHIIIMAGGVGSRLWPVSTPSYPKQFIDLLGVGKSLLQLTAERFAPLCPMDHIWVVTSERYVETVKRQLPSLPDDNILAEPEPRNTAPCIAYACRKISRHYPDANIVVTPSDALVLDVEEYRRVIGEALGFTQESPSIVTVGISPSRPETGYGYIQSTGEQVSGRIERVKAFKEKPDQATAQSYLEKGGYYWNAGIFVWNVQTIEQALRRHAPQIAGVIDQIEPSFFTADEQSTLRRLFPTCEKISIDYAVMEKSDVICTIAADFGWSDLGSWRSILQHSSADSCGNATVGDAISLHNCSGCIVHAADMQQVVVDGLSDYIIAHKDGKLLVCPIAHEQKIKEYSGS